MSEKTAGSKKVLEHADASILDAVKRAARQEQFLEVVSAAEARRRFDACIDRSPLAGETVAACRSARPRARCRRHRAGRCAAVRPFQCRRFCGARRRHRRRRATNAPRRLVLNAEVVACGVQPAVEVLPGTATAIATGGVIPRGADAVVMIEQTELDRGRCLPRDRAAARAPPAGSSSPMPAPTSRAVKRCCAGARASARARSACSRLADLRRSMWCADHASPCSRPATSWSSPAGRSTPAGVYDSNGAIIAAAIIEAGGEPVPFGAFPDEEVALELAMRTALEACDMVVLVGRHVERRGRPVASHRVAARQARHPGAWRGAQARQAAVPRGHRRQAAHRAAGISDLGDLHLPCLRRAGYSRARRTAAGSGADGHGARADADRLRTRPRGIRAGLARRRRATGRSHFRPARARARSRRFPRPTDFWRSTRLPRRSMPTASVDVTLIGEAAAAPDLVIMGSHDVALDVVVGALAARGFVARTIAVGSLGRRCRGQPRRVRPCARSPRRSGDRHLQQASARPRPGARAGLAADAGLRVSAPAMRASMSSAARCRAESGARRPGRADGQSQCRLRHPRADRQPARGARPAGYANQPRSHNAVAAAVAQQPRRLGRRDRAGGAHVRSRVLADRARGIRFSAAAKSRRERPAVQAFLDVAAR